MNSEKMGSEYQNEVEQWVFIGSLKQNACWRTAEEARLTGAAAVAGLLGAGPGLRLSSAVFLSPTTSRLSRPRFIYEEKRVIHTLGPFPGGKRVPF